MRYSSPKCAAYAKDKLNGFEYPTGYRLSVRYPVVTGASGDGFSRAGYVFSLVKLNISFIHIYEQNAKIRIPVQL